MADQFSKEEVATVVATEVTDLESTVFNALEDGDYIITTEYTMEPVEESTGVNKVAVAAVAAAVAGGIALFKNRKKIGSKIWGKLNELSTKKLEKYNDEPADEDVEDDIDEVPVEEPKKKTSKKKSEPAEEAE